MHTTGHFKYAGCAALLLAGCATAPSSGGASGAGPRSNFKEVVDVLRAHTDVIVLSSADERAQVAVVPAFQGRVMTSTDAGLAGPSFGWVNTAAIAAKKIRPQINPWGGEDRFWLGPEGSQFSIFFKPGDPADFQHWTTPAGLDTEGWPVVEKSQRRVVFSKELRLQNAHRTPFELRVDRSVELLDRDAVEAAIGNRLDPGINVVSFASANTITNLGATAWRKETGLLSIWILGMFAPSPDGTVVVPFEPGPVSERGPIVNDDYFGKVPPDRLRVGEGVVYFKGDGEQRGKIGIPRRRAKPVLGSFDPASSVLTLVQFTLPANATEYVNSKWGEVDEPYAGDVANSYNDGPTPAGPPLGPFYELESSSPAAALEPGQSLTHHHRTIHLRGDVRLLDPIAKAVLGVDLVQIANAFR